MESVEFIKGRQVRNAGQVVLAEIRQKWMIVAGELELISKRSVHYVNWGDHVKLSQKRGLTTPLFSMFCSPFLPEGLSGRRSCVDYSLFSVLTGVVILIELFSTYRKYRGKTTKNRTQMIYSMPLIWV